MTRILLNTVALDPNRWTTPKHAYFNLTDLLAPIGTTGFTALEIWQYHLQGLSSHDIDELALRLRDSGLSTVVIGLYPVLAGELAGASLEESRHLIGVAKRLGADSIKIFVGDLPSESISDTDWAESLSNLDEMIGIADSEGLEINGETHQNTLFDDILSVEHTMAAVGEGRMGICFQPYDFSDSFGTIEVLRKIAGDVRHVHFQGRTSSGEFCLLEHAPIDYRRLIGVLARAGFDGPLSIEFVKDCVVSAPELMDLQLVLANAEKDRLFLSRVAHEAGLTSV